MGLNLGSLTRGNLLASDIGHEDVCVSQCRKIAGKGGSMYRGFEGRRWWGRSVVSEMKEGKWCEGKSQSGSRRPDDLWS